jgi:DNA-binding NtrC family response regulator
VNKVAGESVLLQAEALLRLRDYGSVLAILSSFKTESSSELLWADALRAECFALTGRQREAHSIAARIMQATEATEKHELYGRACFAAGLASYRQGKFENAGEYFEMSYHAHRRCESPLGRVRSLNWLGITYFYRAKFDRALEYYSRAMPEARSAGLPREELAASMNGLLALMWSGRLAEARERLPLARKLTLANRDELNVLRTELIAASLYTHLREFNEAKTILESLNTSVFYKAHQREQGAWCEYSAELALATGDPDSAVRYAERAIRIATTGDRDESVVGQAGRILTEALVAKGDYARAQTAGDEALACLQRIGERIEVAIVQRALGDTACALGQTDSARDLYRASVELLRTIGARLELVKSCLRYAQPPLLPDHERLAVLFEAQRLTEAVGIGYWRDQVRDALAGLVSVSDSGSDQDGEGPIAMRPDEDFIAVSPAMKHVMELASGWASTDMTVLITGETGVGKDRLAKIIHDAGPRRDRPFVAIDLATLSPSLWESELFGHRRGAFTGAGKDHQGLLPSADGGTVFLNEIGNLSLESQTKLLEFLETRQVRPVGETSPIALNVRVIAATNRDLRVDVQCGSFREDLYYRLEQAPLTIPSLRDRTEDIRPLLEYYFERFGFPAGYRAMLEGAGWFVRAQRCRWPGNVRRLRNICGRMAALARIGPSFDPVLCGDDLLEWLNDGARETVSTVTERVMPPGREQILAALHRHDWNQRAAARELGISEGGVRYHMRRFDIQRPMSADEISRIA